MIKHAATKALLAAFFAVGTFVMVAFVLYQVLVPANLGTFKQLRLDQKEVKAGSLVFYEAHDCKPSNHVADVFRTLSTNTIPPEVTLSAGARFDDRLQCRNAILIPAEAPTGEYRLNITVEYSVNAFQNKTETYQSEPFRVINTNEEFNILQDAVRNEVERQNNQPITPPTPTEDGSSSNLQSSNTTARIQPAAPAGNGGNPTPSNPQTTIPQGPVQRTVNGVVGGAIDGVNDITRPVLCNPLIQAVC